MGKISISNVLAEIDQTVDETGKPVTFSLNYTRNDGTVGKVEKASKGFKDKRHEEEGEKEGGKSNKQYSSNILLYNHDKQAFREYSIHLLTHYNGYKIHFG